MKTQLKERNDVWPSMAHAMRRLNRANKDPLPVVLCGPWFDFSDRLAHQTHSHIRILEERGRAASQLSQVCDAEANL